MWFKADDNLDCSVEAKRIPRRSRAHAIGVWTQCGTYTSRLLTDGYVPNEVFEEFGGSPAIRRHLIDAGFLAEADDLSGVVLTAQRCRIPTASQVQQERNANAKRVQKHRNRVALGEQETVTPLQECDTGLVNGTGVTNSLSSLAVVTNRGMAPTFVENDHTWDLATSERGVGPPVKVGAARLVATLVGDKVDNAAKTVLRLKANEMLCAGESEEDVAECIRVWLAEPDLRAAGLPLCMVTVRKRRINGRALTSTERYAVEIDAIGKELIAQQSRKELE